nr:unnamed protein product [Digitaria exilis]
MFRIAGSGRPRSARRSAVERAYSPDAVAAFFASRTSSTASPSAPPPPPRSAPAAATAAGSTRAPSSRTPLTSAGNASLVSSSCGMSRAAVRAIQRDATRTSKVVAVSRRCGGRRRFLRATTSVGVKVNVLVVMSPDGGGTGSYSGWGNVGSGGLRASRSSRDHGGDTVGAGRPRASSPTADKNWTMPTPSHMPGSLEVGQPHVGVGLDEQHPLAGAVDDELPPLHLPQPPGERVVRHQRLAERAPDDGCRVVTVAARDASSVEEDERHMQPQPLLVIDVGEALRLARRRPRRADELRLLTAHRCDPAAMMITRRVAGDVDDTRTAAAEDETH